MTELDPACPESPRASRASIPGADSEVELARPVGTLHEPDEPGESDGPAGMLDAAQARTFAFTSPSLAILIAITPMAGTFRLDGWLSPGAALRLELCSAAPTGAGDTGAGDTSITTGHADDGGRFDFVDVPAGLAQLVVHPTAGCPLTLRTAVVTPAVEF